ncbi:MAG: DUF6702 family protein [Bacteroidota bacterium]
MRKSFLLAVVLLPLLSFTLHKFYVSVTNINYSEEDASFQITSRVFIDDLEAVLEERYDIDPELATQNEAKVADEYIEKYFKAKFAVELNGEITAYSFLGKKYDNDVVICYLELTDVDFSTLKSISVQNEILTDMFEEQKNIVHFKWKDEKRSFVLIRENNKGMLNF